MISSRREPFEIGARLFAILAFPGTNEAVERRRAANAWCAGIINCTKQQEPASAAGLDAKYPRYAAMDQRSINQALRKTKKHDDQVDSTSQALANMTFLTGAEAWIEYYRSLVEERDNPPMDIRLNHPDKGMRFHLFGGRVAVRDEDGSFLVTAEECRYAMQIEGIQRVS